MFVYFDGVTEKRGRKILYPLVHSSSGSNGPMSQTRSPEFPPYLTLESRDPGAWGIFGCFPGTSTESWAGSKAIGLELVPIWDVVLQAEAATVVALTVGSLRT